MNVIAEVQGDSVLLSTSHTDERGRLAARLLAHTDDPRTVQKVTGRRGAPGVAYRVPLAVAEAAGFLPAEPDEDAAPDAGVVRADNSGQDADNPVTSTDNPASPADNPAGDPDNPAGPEPVPAKKAPAKKAAPRTARKE